MKRVLLLAVVVVVAFTATADALSKRTARQVTYAVLSDAYLARDWASDWDFYGCRRKGEHAFVCYGGVSGEREGKFETRYTSCDLKVLVRDRDRLEAGVVKTRCRTF